MQTLEGLPENRPIHQYIPVFRRRGTVNHNFFSLRLDGSLGHLARRK